MSLKRITSVVAGVLLLGMAADARAHIIFSTAQGSLQPDENVLFNCAVGCVSGPSTTVVGETNQTGTLITFTGTENLVTPASGQARIEAEDGSYNYILVNAQENHLFFSEFEANVNIVTPGPGGTATVVACNQFGVCYTNSYGLGPGENFFVLSVLDPQLIDTVQITTTVGIADLRQVRVTVAEGTTDVPEPASLALFGLALAVGASRFRRKP